MQCPTISICIPAYEMHGKGAEFLEQLFESIRQQTFQDFEVIVSDHSQDSAIREICTKWEHVFPISYLHFTEQRGNSSANLNNALNVAKGEIIKPMHQDDFFYSPTALQEIVGAVSRNPDFVWGASGFVHTNEKRSHFYRYQMPVFLPDTQLIRNTIGAPSVMFFRNHKAISFDENLIWMNDAELTYRLNAQFGRPFILETTLVVIRQWSRQVTHTLARKTVRLNEIRYCVRKHHCWFRFITAEILLRFRRICGLVPAHSGTSDLFESLVESHPETRQQPVDVGRGDHTQPQRKASSEKSAR
jgi:glycosyltransferase involved in cell wall biosynthesis